MESNDHIHNEAALLPLAERIVKITKGGSDKSNDESSVASPCYEQQAISSPCHDDYAENNPAEWTTFGISRRSADVIIPSYPRMGVGAVSSILPENNTLPIKVESKRR